MPRDRFPTLQTTNVTLKVINPDLHDRPPPPPEHKAWRMPESMGLGDWVETWAKPIARWIDALTARLACWSRRQRLNRFRTLVRALRTPGRPAIARLMAGLGRLAAALAGRVLIRAGLRRTKIVGCGGCSSRRRWLNRLVPDIRSIRAWAGAIRVLLSLCRKPLDALLNRALRPPNHGSGPRR